MGQTRGGTKTQSVRRRAGCQDDSCPGRTPGQNNPVELRDKITGSLEDNRVGCVLSAVDFSKALNRFNHEHCLKQFTSADLVQLLAAFLMGRTMTVRVGGTF